LLLESAKDALEQSSVDRERNVDLSRHNEALEKQLAELKEAQAKQAHLDEVRYTTFIEKLSKIDISHTDIWIYSDYYWLIIHVFVVFMVTCMVFIYHSKWFIMPVVILAFLLLFHVVVYFPRFGKRYRYKFLSWMSDDYQLHADLRADTCSLADLKHNAQYAVFTFEDRQCWSLRQRLRALFSCIPGDVRPVEEHSQKLYVSVELLAQLTTAECMSLVANRDTAWQKTYAKAKTLQTVNVNRYMFALGMPVVQHTATLAEAMYVEMHEKLHNVPFPRPAP
jgi:hypothetical protein